MGLVQQLDKGQALHEDQAGLRVQASALESVLLGGVKHILGTLFYVGLVRQLGGYIAI